MSLTLRSLAPTFAEEIAGLLLVDDEPDLASQVLSAEIVARCDCDDDFCASFYTAALPPGPYGADHESIQLDPRVGMVILDTVQGRLVYVEVLYNSEFRVQLRLALP